MKQPQADMFTRDLFAWLNQVKSDGELPASAFKVAFEIGQHINRASGEAWPSTDRIAKRIGMSQATVVEMVRRLEANGHLEIEKGRQGRGHSHRYRKSLKPRPADLCEPAMGQVANVFDHSSPAKNLGPLCANLSPLSSKPQPPDKNHLTETYEDTSEGERLGPADQYDRSEDGRSQKGQRAESVFSKTAGQSPQIALLFAQFWKAYPRKINKITALRAFTKALASGDTCFSALIAGALRYAAERVGQENRYTVYPARWIEEKRYLDERPKGNAGPIINEQGIEVRHRARSRSNVVTYSQIAEEMLIADGID